MYQGKEKIPNYNAKNNDSLGSKVVLSMTRHLENPNDREIYVDNFFSSYGLLVQMKSLCIRITGTIRSNLTARCPLKDDKLLKREE